MVLIVFICLLFPTYKIQVDEDGIYKLDKSFLDDAGVNLLGVDPKTIRIFNKGEEIPIYVYGEDDGVFDATDYIEFYGTRNTSCYTNDNVYWFSYGENPGLRMSERDGSPVGFLPVPNCFMDSVHFEENHWYSYNHCSHGEDHWFWTRIDAPGTQDFPFNLSNVSDTLADVLVYIRLRGASDTTHHAIVRLNGNLLIDTLWSSYERCSCNISISQSMLQQNNTLQIESPGDMGPEKIFVNYFGIKYWREYSANNDALIFCGPLDIDSLEFRIKGFTSDNLALFDITDERKPIRITGFITQLDAGNYTLTFQGQNTRYLALTADKREYPKSMLADEPSDLHNLSNGADYIIITHKNFYNNILPLAVLRESQGLRVEVVKIQDVYDEFSFGIFNPDAIKYFLEYAYYNWQTPRPTYVLLVGDASYDYKNYLGVSKNYVPTHLFESSYEKMEVSSDNWFVCVEGADVLPDMFIGRLPVRTNTDADVMVNKTIGYETNLPVGEWRKTVLLVADDSDKGGDEAIFDSTMPYIPMDYPFWKDSNFEEASNEVAGAFPADFTIKKVYLSEYTLPDSATSDIISYIDTGCVVVNFFGHSAIDIWTQERIFESSDIYLLNNGDKFPLVNVMGCVCGFFHHPTNEYCIAEEFLRADGKGAIACFAPSGLGNLPQMKVLNKALFDAFFQDHNIVLGSAIAQAKVKLLEQYPGHWDHLEMFNLLGDPALRMPFEVGVEEREEMRDERREMRVYPNPFTHKTVISYRLSVIGEDLKPITLCIYDLSGRLVKSFSLTPNPLSLTTAVEWDGKDNKGKRVSCGAYFCRLKFDGKLTQKLIYVIE